MPTQVQNDLIRLAVHGISDRKIGKLYSVRPEAITVLRTNAIALQPTTKLCAAMIKSGIDKELSGKIRALADGLETGVTGVPVKLPIGMWSDLK